MTLAEKVAKTDVGFINGPTGTGKRFYRSLFITIPQMDRPFVGINCAAIPENMLGQFYLVMKRHLQVHPALTKGYSERQMEEPCF